MLTDMRLAAMGVLLIHLKIEMGATIWTQFPQLKTLPEEALPHFVAAQMLPADATQDDLLTLVDEFEKMLLVYRQCRHAFHMLATSIPTFASGNGQEEPALLMVLSTERWPTW